MVCNYCNILSVDMFLVNWRRGFFFCLGTSSNSEHLRHTSHSSFEADIESANAENNILVYTDLEENGSVVVNAPANIIANITDAEWNEILERSDISAKVKLCVWSFSHSNSAYGRNFATDCWIFVGDGEISKRSRFDGANSCGAIRFNSRFF